MLIEYQISESDYKHGFSRMIVPRFEGKDFLKILVLPLGGLLLVAASARDLVRSNFSAAHAPPLVLGLMMLLAYIFLLRMLSRGARKAARQIYRNTDWLRGRLFLEVTEDGIQFTGENFLMKTRWAEFLKFFEDRRTFILHQRNPQHSQPPLMFHVLPKRTLSRDQIESLRQYLQSKIATKKAAPARPMAS
jgi:YcxB-like protein